MLNVKEIGENCLIKIFDGDGSIDEGKILKDGNRFVLNLKGIVDPKIERHKNISWEIDIEAGKIKTEEKEMDESLQEKLLQQSKNRHY